MLSESRDSGNSRNISRIEETLRLLRLQRNAVRVTILTLFVIPTGTKWSGGICYFV